MITFDLSPSYKGEGISEGLERGVLVFFDDKNLIQEGMGLGTVALRTRNLTYFSRSSKLKRLSVNEYVKEFYIDTIMNWKLFNKRSMFLTKIIEEFGNFYKKEGGSTQDFLLTMGVWLRKLFGITSEMTNYKRLGKVIFNYKFLKNQVKVSVDFSQILKDNPEKLKFLCILNELGGDYFNRSKIGKQIRPAPSGWSKIKDSKSLEKIKLYSEGLKLEFGIEILRILPICKINYFFGRENIANYCWSGFGMEIDINSIDSNAEQCLIEYIFKFDLAEDREV
ncbi:MAG: hypothetical protein ACFFCD_17920 [Promethearchaeota archaeon]